MLQSASRFMWRNLDVKVIDGMFMKPAYGDDVAGSSRDVRLRDLDYLMCKLDIVGIEMRRLLQCRENSERNAIKQIERVLDKLMI